MFPRRELDISRIWPLNFFKMPTMLSGFAWMTINTLAQHSIYQKNTAKWHFARLITINLEDIMQHTKPTSGSHRPTTGRSCGQTFSNTLKHASDVNDARSLLISLLRFNFFQIRNGQMSESMRICSDQCSLQDDNTSTSCVSRTNSQNTLSSRRSRTRRPRWS